MQSNEIKWILTLIAGIASNLLRIFLHILWRAFFFQGKTFPVLYQVQVGLYGEVKIWTKGIPLFNTEVDWNIFTLIPSCLTLRAQIFFIFFAEVY